MNLKTRFTLFVSLLFTALLTGISFFIYFDVKNRALTLAKETLSNHLYHEGQHLNNPIENRYETSTPHFHGIYHRIWKNDRLMDDNFPPQLARFEMPEVSLENKRIIEKVTVVYGENVYELLGYFDITSTAEYLEALRKTLLTAGMLALLLVILVSGGLISFLIDPFRKLSEGAAKISAAKLSYRFSPSKSNDEYGTLVNSFNKLLDRLQTSFAQLDRFAQNASHELRTPLTVIIAESERVRRKPRQSKEYEMAIDRILAQAITLRGITNNLLFLTDVERAKNENRSTPIQVKDRVLDVVSSLQGIRPGPEKHIQCDFDPALQFKGHPELFLCILSNLIENSLKFSSHKVQILARQLPAGIDLTIEDDGPGVPERDREKVFEPFVKLPSTQPTTEGHGLGLSIVKSSVEAFSGRIWLGDSVLGGLSVRVQLFERSVP